MKKLIAAALAMTLAAGLAACGGSSDSVPTTSASSETQSDSSVTVSGDIVPIDKSYKWNVAMNVSESTLNYKFYEVFKQNLEYRSDGKITLNLFPNGQLGGDAEQLLSLMDNTVQFSTTITSGMTSTIPQYGVWDLPNAFNNVDQLRAVEDNEDVLNALNEASANKGIHLMGLADAGFRELTSDKEVHAVDDLKGLKIRVIDNPYHQLYWTSLGASTTTMDFNEVYSSLQQKVIDAEENPYMNITANRFYEVQPYIVETNHLGHIMVFTMNNALYESLPDNVRTLVDECASEALKQTREAADNAIGEYRKIIEDYGCEIITLDDSVLQEMQEKAQPVYDRVRKDLGDDLVDTFVNAAEAAKTSN